MSRPKHPKKELEALLREAEELGWRVSKRAKGYFKMKCPCSIHIKTIHLSPSDSRYEQNVRGWLKRSGCWTQKEDETDD